VNGAAMTAGQWSEGYVTEVGYTHGYYPELNPLRAGFCLLMEGWAPPPPGPCCELGFGQGVSLAMHAAGDPQRRWWGNDFNPAHALHARGLVDAAGADAVVAEQSFEDFCSRSDLPEFAFIAAHGVWSWVSEANRQRIVDFVRRHLMPGGVLYLSYNLMAGWSALLPLRQLLADHERWAAPAGRDRAERAREAVLFAQRVFGVDSVLLRNAPSLRARAADLQGKPAGYLLHEYMNRDWQPMSFGEVRQRLQAARLDFACSTDLHARLLDIQFSPEQQALLAQIESPWLRADVADLFSGQRLRRDLWVRGQRRLTRMEQIEQLQALHVVLTLDPADVPRSIKGACGEATMVARSLDALLDELVRAGGAVALGTVIERLAARGTDADETLTLVSSLVGLGAVEPAQDPAHTLAAQPATGRLNAHLLQRSVRRQDLGWLASPVTGGAVPVAPPVQALLAAREAAPGRPAAWPAAVWEALKRHGHQLVKDGKAVNDDAAGLAMLGALVPQLQNKVLPALRRLRAIDEPTGPGA
jgi:SAM-dependent methyltransferase